MIFPLGGLALGAAMGAVMAVRRGGNPLDIAQWTAVLAIMMGLVGLVAMVFLDRVLM